MMTTSRRLGLWHTLRHLYTGQSLMRIEMNKLLAQETIRGAVVDVGGGRAPDYFNYFCTENGTHIKRIDGSLSCIDFEKDSLPVATASIDTAILCNVLEHVYHYQFLMSEVRRVLAPRGRLIGAVPFWVGYHPDPRDYFRYTQEALAKILAEAGFSEITIRPISGGPILANFNTIVLSLPRILRPLLYLWYTLLNRLFLSVRPESIRRNPLGFVFTASAK